MDGNGRWAKSKGFPRLIGHKNGVKSVKKITEICADLKVEHLTLYTFSEQNWDRPIDEVSGLMKLFVHSLKNEIKNLKENNIRFNIIGDFSKINSEVKKEISCSINETKSNTGMNLNLAFSYGSRQEIINMVKNIAIDFNDKMFDLDSINSFLIDSYLYTANIPHPDLLIRTGGEYRLSNFLLWQIAYSEIYFTETYWPSFSKEDLLMAICDYQNRERRFGKVSEQIS